MTDKKILEEEDLNKVDGGSVFAMPAGGQIRTSIIPDLQYIDGNYYCEIGEHRIEYVGSSDGYDKYKCPFCRYDYWFKKDSGQWFRAMYIKYNPWFNN